MIVGIAELLDTLQSVRFYARRLADEHTSDRDLTRAVDALDAHVDRLVDEVAADGDAVYRTVSFRVAPLGQEHRLHVTARGPEVVVVLVDDSGGEVTLALAATGYPQIVAALRSWADRVEAEYTE